MSNPEESDFDDFVYCIMYTTFSYQAKLLIIISKNALHM